MGISVFPLPSAASKTMFRTTLTSGTSYTVPAGVTYLNVTLVGGGGGAGGVEPDSNACGNPDATSGQTISSTLSVTAGASISYAIGAGGAGATGVGSGSNGGTTTFTGATSATGGIGGKTGATGAAGTISFANNGGKAAYTSGAFRAGGAGGSGWIEIEYWA